MSARRLNRKPTTTPTTSPDQQITFDRVSRYKYIQEIINSWNFTAPSCCRNFSSGLKDFIKTSVVIAEAEFKFESSTSESVSAFFSRWKLASHVSHLKTMGVRSRGFPTVFILLFLLGSGICGDSNFMKNAKISTRIVQTKYGRLQGLLLPMDQYRYLKPIEVR